MAAQKQRRRPIGIYVGAALLTALLGYLLYEKVLRFPPDTTPEGAYLRIATSLQRGNELIVFSYLEDAAQHAGFTIRDYRKKAYDRVAEDFPEPERSKLLTTYEPFAKAPDGSDVWLFMARERGWLTTLRKDLSGISSVEETGPRATVVTARGTRYSFRQRHNGMYGLTLFTAEMLAEADRAARDLAMVEQAAADYAADTKATTPASPSSTP